MVRPPEGLAVTLPGSILARHLALLICKFASENRSRPRAAKQVCEKWTLTLSLLCGKQFPVSSRKFPVQVRREFWRNQLTYGRKTEPSSRLRGEICEISLYFPAYQGI
jgi:hypothetical protein